MEFDGIPCNTVQYHQILLDYEFHSIQLKTMIRKKSQIGLILGFHDVHGAPWDFTMKFHDIRWDFFFQHA